jgi:hypothetical protein
MPRKSAPFIRGSGREDGLEIVFSDPDSPAGQQILNASSFLVAPELSRPFAEGFIATCSVMRGRSRQSEINNLKRGFFAFIRGNPDLAKLRIEKLSTSLFEQFIAHLGRKIEGKFVESASVRIHKLGIVRKIVGWLSDHKIYAKQLPSNCDIRRNPWPNASRQYDSTDLLDEDTWNRLYRVSTDEVANTTRQVREQRQALERGSARLASMSRTFLRLDTLEIALAYAKEAGIDVARLGDIDHPRLRRFVTTFGFNNFLKTFYPAPGDLICFVYTIAMQTLLNKQQIMDLQYSEISYQDLLGTERIVFEPKKWRSGGKKQRRSFQVSDDLDNPALIIEFLRQWTNEIRPQLPLPEQDRVFIFVMRGRDDQFAPSSFKDNRHGFSHHFANHAKAFCNRNGLPSIGFRQIRYTGLDLVHALFAGDLRAVQAIGNQKSPQTILDHYTSKAARKRNDAQLTSAINLRARFVDSIGKIDPRTQPLTADQGAATPGWGCMDPYASPMPGERIGRLCGAFGFCPICPLAYLDTKSPYSLARLVQLDQKLDEARTNLGAQRWLSAWAPVQQKIRSYWLKHFHDEGVIKKAEDQHLNDLPDPE